MKKLLATASAVIALSTAADASTVAFGFKDSVGVANGATEITWTNGGISLSQTDKQLTVDIWGQENLTGSITAWVIDWAAPMATAEKFDIYINPDFNPCNILVTFITEDWNTGKQNIFWDQANTAKGGYCTKTEGSATLTASLAVMPLPAGALLLLSGLAGIGAVRRFS